MALDIKLPWSLEYNAFNSMDLNREIEEELYRRSTDEDSAFESSAFDDSSSGTWEQSAGTYQSYACAYPELPTFKFGLFINDLDILDDEDDQICKNPMLVNPRTGQKVTNIFGDEESIDPCKESMTSWDHDHDYIGKKGKSEIAEENGRMNILKLSKSESEPVVEVWKIENFPEDPETADPEPADAWNRYRVEVTGRRTSTRAAELKQKMQARKLTNAVRVGLTNDKAKRTRQYKNIKPKNSVETTPSQSDIEEWSSYPARPTHTKMTKKKTSKGRIDHSESERHRREVLRANFAALCELIPTRYLRGEKVSSQISKQKILNGGKAYIEVLQSCKGSYKVDFLQNQHFKDRWQKRTSLLKLLKCSKKK